MLRFRCMTDGRLLWPARLAGGAFRLLAGGAFRLAGRNRAFRPFRPLFGRHGLQGPFPADAALLSEEVRHFGRERDSLPHATILPHKILLDHLRALDIP